MDERIYREKVKEIYDLLAKAFDSIDPDVAEFEMVQGAGKVLFPDGSSCILSTQPSVRQIWLAAASKGIAHHFNYDDATKRWMDDKGKGVELLGFIASLVNDVAGVRLKI